MRVAFLAADAIPFFRRYSMAFSMSAAVSVSAFLQSAIPAPVRSLKSLIICVVTSAMFLSSSFETFELKAFIATSQPLRRGGIGATEGSGSKKSGARASPARLTLREALPGGLRGGDEVPPAGLGAYVGGTKSPPRVWGGLV